MIWTLLQRGLFSCCILTWGGVMLYFYRSVHLDAYLAPNFQFTLLVGGLACSVVDTLVVTLASMCASGNEMQITHHPNLSPPFWAPKEGNSDSGVVRHGPSTCMERHEPHHGRFVFLASVFLCSYSQNTVGCSRVN